MKSTRAGKKGVRVQGDAKGAFRKTLFKGYSIEGSGGPSDKWHLCRQYRVNCLGRCRERIPTEQEKQVQTLGQGVFLAWSRKSKKLCGWANEGEDGREWDQRCRQGLDRVKPCKDRSYGNVSNRELMVSTSDFKAVTLAECTKQRGSRNSPGRTQGS